MRYRSFSVLRLGTVEEKTTFFPPAFPKRAPINGGEHQYGEHQCNGLVKSLKAPNLSQSGSTATDQSLNLIAVRVTIINISCITCIDYVHLLRYVQVSFAHSFQWRLRCRLRAYQLLLLLTKEPSEEIEQSFPKEAEGALSSRS